MTIQTFKRYELKYKVTQEQYEQLIDVMRDYMDEDSHCVQGKMYTIHNLYFDTEDDELIRKSIEKPYYKEKLRLRTYGEKSKHKEHRKMFLELKKKIGGIVAKRRVVLTYEEAIAFVEQGVLPIRERYQDQQVIAEIKGFLSRYALKSKVVISYDRMAFFAKQDTTFRMSFDRHIRTRRRALNFDDQHQSELLLSKDELIMEIKCSGAIPLWLTKELSRLKIYRTSFSKYGNEYRKMNKTKQNLLENKLLA